jgi:hypothetical protein
LLNGRNVTKTIIMTMNEMEESCLWAQPKTTLQRHNTKNSKQILPERELRGRSPNFHIHVSVNSLYIPTINLPILLQEICRPLLGIYVNRSQTHECRNLDLGRAVPRKEKHKWDFRCSAHEGSLKFLK